jgi:fructokinase
MMPLFGGIVAGGTKCVCAVGSGRNDIRHEIRFPTTTPDETIGRALAYFTAQAALEPLASIGIATFGPIDCELSSRMWGYITTTPKPGWTNTDFAARIRRELRVPVGFDTDVNGAALAESRRGAGKGASSLAYVTVGTGIGGGLVLDNTPVHGAAHPELGLIYVRRPAGDSGFAGICPHHGDCLEGLCTGPAMAKRWGVKAETLPADHPAWQLEAKYLAWGVCNLIYTFSPQRVVLGGGVFGHPGLIDMVRQQIVKISNGYVHSPKMTLEEIDQYVVPPRLGNQSGVLGAIALAMTLEKSKNPCVRDN